jgi:hypothetical protein
MPVKVKRFCKVFMSLLAGAEPHYGLGGLGPPKPKGSPQKFKKKSKKKRKNIIFTPIL